MHSADYLSFSSSSSSASATVRKIYWPGFVGFLVLLAFTWIPNSYSLMVGWPYVLIWQCSFLLIGACTFGLCRRFRIPFTRLGYGLDLVVLISLLSILSSTIFSSFRAVALWNFLLVFDYVIVLYFLVNWLRSETVTRSFLWMFVSLSGVVTSTIGLSMWRPNVDMWLSENFYDAIRNAQPLGHHNFVGGYALLVLPLVVGFSFSQFGWRKTCFAVASVIVAITLYVSGSRGALLGMLVLGIISAIFGIAYSEKVSRRRWIVSGICFLLIMSIALISNPRVRALFSVNPAVEKDSISVVSLTDGPTKDRVLMLESAWNIIKTRPAFGVGPGSLSRVYGNYRPVEAGSGLNLVQQLHNTPAQIIAELGLFGFVSYLLFILTMVKIGLDLHEDVKSSHDRILLYSIAASWIGYGVSSLSDFQLENVGISIILISTTALFVNLVDSTKTDITHLHLPNKMRRAVSMLLLLVLCISLHIWIRVDVGLFISHGAVQNAKSLNLADAARKWNRASQLVPWDPTYSALSAETVLELMDSLESENDIEEIRLLAIEHMKKTVQAAPNDPWFNQNLATLLIDSGDSVAAESYAREAVRLSPRDRSNYTYYTLGISLLNQGKRDEAIASFVLEAIANPIFLTATNWNQSPLISIRTEVVSTALQSYRDILSKTNKLSMQYSWLYEQLSLLSWWYDYPIPEDDLRELRPLVQAILVSNEDSEESLLLIDDYLSKGGIRGSDIYLIQTRLSPSRYLSELSERMKDMLDEQIDFAESFREPSTMQEWLNAVTTPAKTQTRYGLVYAYRNLAANVIRKILYPGEIRNSTILSSSDLFQPAYREYPQLDRHMAEVRSSQLNID